MSIRAMNWAIVQNPGAPGPKQVLMALAYRADLTGWCCVGLPQLGMDTQLPERTLRSHIDRLEELGMVKRLRRHRRNGSRAANAYLLPIKDKPATVAGSQQATTADRRNLAATVAGGGEPSGRNGVHQPAIASPPTSFEPTDERSRVEEASSPNSAHAWEKTAAASATAVDEEDEVIEAMALAAEQHAATIEDPVQRRSFLAEAQGLWNGLDETAWFDNRADARVPMSERLRLFRLAILHFVAKKRSSMHAAVILAIQQQRDPFEVKTARNSAGSQASEVKAKPRNSDGTETLTQSHEPRSSGGSFERMNGQKLFRKPEPWEISKWEQSHPADAEALRKEALEATAASLSPTLREDPAMEKFIATTAKMRYRQMVGERIAPSPA